MSAIPIVGSVLELVLQIVRWVEEGLSTKEIQERIADPNGVGKDLSERIQQRHARGRSLLGRDPH